MATGPSEFEGTGPTAAGVRNTSQLTASEKLKLIYRTGQEQDPEADVDPLAFQGSVTL